jgi:hypothetical protein
MSTTLIQTLETPNGEIYAVKNDRRVLFAKCTAKVDVYEHIKRVDVLGGEGYNVRTHYSTSLYCTGIETTRDADIEYLRGLSGFAFSGDFQRADGVFERVKLDVVPDTLDLCGGDWEFRVNGTGELVKRLITF